MHEFLASLFLLLSGGLAEPATSGRISEQCSQRNSLFRLEQSCTASAHARVEMAVIFGDNNLDDHDVKTQCESTFGKESAPTGKFFRIKNGRTIAMGSGDLVFANDVVVTAAHSFRWNGMNRIDEKDSVYFAMYELSPEGACIRRHYSVASWVIGTQSPEFVSQRGRDFAVVKLAEPVLSYYPLELLEEEAMGELIQRIKTGDARMILAGFGNHPSTHDGKDLSVMIGNGFPVPPRHLYNGVKNVILHDIDSVPGLSGGALSYVSRNDAADAAHSGRSLRKFFLGIHVGDTSRLEGVKFNIHQEYSVGILLDGHMRAMILRAATD